MIMGIFTAILGCMLLGAIFYNEKCARNYRKMYREAGELRMKIFKEMTAGEAIARHIRATGDYPDTVKGKDDYIIRQMRIIGQYDRRLQEAYAENDRLRREILKLHEPKRME